MSIGSDGSTKRLVEDAARPSPSAAEQTPSSCSLAKRVLECNPALLLLKPEEAADLTKQLETFPQDIERLRQGRISYAEMRSRYG